MDKKQQPPCKPSPRLKGVQIVYEDDGVLYCGWLDLTKSDGLSWCPGDPPRKNNPPKGKKPKYTTPPDLTGCQPATQAVESEAMAADGLTDGPPICWWTGSEWECGEM